MHQRLDSVQSYYKKAQPIVYASRALTDTECRYSNIERELLGVVFGTQKTASLYIWEIYHSQDWPSATQKLYGKRLLQLSSLRLQRLLLRLAQYKVHIEYLWGTENFIADPLSRVAPLKLERQEWNISLNNIEKIPVHQITQIAPASPERLQEIHVRPHQRIQN